MMSMNCVFSVSKMLQSGNNMAADLMKAARGLGISVAPVLQFPEAFEVAPPAKSRGCRQPENKS
jgi:hypothetical protein